MVEARSLPLDLGYQSKVIRVRISPRVYYLIESRPLGSVSFDLNGGDD